MEYSPSVLRWLVRSRPELDLLGVTLAGDDEQRPAPATMRNQSEIGTPVATPPAMARNTNPAATATRSITGSCLSQMVYGW